jgi:hypothetical protein
MTLIEGRGKEEEGRLFLNIVLFYLLFGDIINPSFGEVRAVVFFELKGEGSAGILHLVVLLFQTST